MPSVSDGAVAVASPASRPAPTTLIGPFWSRFSRPRAALAVW